MAHATQVESFELVTTVPSGERDRDIGHPLMRIVGELVAPTRDRHERLLRRSATEVPPRAFDAARFEAVRRLGGEPVLLIDDTWTSGASAQSAAAALRGAGSGPVAALVIGRHINPEWHDSERRLKSMSGTFDWDKCALCAGR